ncbi:branched-chain alpha-keto acid dehydrogenase E2 component [Hoeflea halophila]|uniref:Dihydrolipoamide acetyltransferase component of pyruvate dehydrogenase complex n=1 Tax=Hoeflea halophila TaxID=714899 RepID=A0A286HME5_9HYPH|nr:dihydrolipoamide acetyltransferase family protein [Hoeflea halophila]SOE08897.1 branched-chain alpha-keto acid dehydrogenase E2 component [Hoeflea halophila]
MGIFTINLPDVGEGIAEAELTEWNVGIGDQVNEDDVLGTVMTDKAAVEVPSSVSGKVVWLCGEPGDTVAIGARFVEIEVEGTGNAKDGEKPAETRVEESAPEPAMKPQRDVSRTGESAKPDPAPAESSKLAKAGPAMTAQPPARSASLSAPRGGHERSVPLAPGAKPLASPSVRQHARDAGIDLRRVSGSGPGGRILHEDIDAFADDGRGSGRFRAPKTGSREVKVIGMRRRIAEKMTQSWSRIPHITIVEEIDVTALEDLRTALNTEHASKRGKLTLLPFVMRAIVAAVKEQPAFNARYDDDAGVIEQFDGVHIGIATQTPSGLTVPVVRHAEARSLWESAAEMARLAEAARDGKASRDELSGSTISITSLGPLGAIATTPIINHPEVAIVGVNKMAVRPMWDGQQFQPRKMMNISCSFDHRVIDGWDAAVFVQKLKSLIETPALLFIED